MNWKKIKAITSLGVFALFVVGAGIGAILVQQNQDTRQQASGGCEFMNETDKVPGVYASIESNKVTFCDPDGGEYTIFVKYNNKPIDQEKISEETKTFSPGEVYIYNNVCPPPDASYTKDLAININTADKKATDGWGHVYTCPTNSIQPDLSLTVEPTTSPQSPESAEVTQTPREPDVTSTPTSEDGSTLLLINTPTPTTVIIESPTPTVVKATVTPFPTITPEPTLSTSENPIPTLPMTSEFPTKPSPTGSESTSKAQCNESCVFNSDCENVAHICADTSVGKRCRLRADTESLLCVILEEFPSPTPTGTQSSKTGVTPTITTTPLTQCRADINHDGIVDLSDYLLVRNVFLKRGINVANEVAVADIDKDGIVDLVDYSILVQEFFMHCQN